MSANNTDNFFSRKKTLKKFYMSLFTAFLLIFISIIALFLKFEFLYKLIFYITGLVFMYSFYLCIVLATSTSKKINKRLKEKEQLLTDDLLNDNE